MAAVATEAEEADMDDLELYEDEPMTSVRASAFSGNDLVIQNLDEMERKRQKRRRRRRRRLERLGKIAVCVCCLGSILALILTFVLTKAAIAVTKPKPPTMHPTKMPSIPTYKPTREHPTIKNPTGKPPSMISTPENRPVAAPTPVPTFTLQNNYTLTATQDTYIYTKGALVINTFGREDTLLVQTGKSRDSTSPTAISLLIFDTKSIPDFSVLPGKDRKATLKLQHKPLKLNDQSREAAKITVARMDSTPTKIESISGSDYTLPKTWDGPTKVVDVDATEVLFDISDIYFNTNFDSENQLYLVLEARDQEQEVGDKFFSRESDTPPQLILNGLLE